MTDTAPKLADIRAAARRIAGAVIETPCLASETLSAITGCCLHLKFENLQFTASFKERGALNRLLTLGAAERDRGVCAMSAGNHAQGVARHAHRLGIPATIVMPEGTPLTKISRTREHGAHVVVSGANLDEAEAHARDLAEAGGLTFVHPFDDAAVIAGQGTIALELLSAVPDLDTLIVPVGGGGLAAGVVVAAKALRPEIEVIGVQTAAYPSMAQALGRSSGPLTAGETIAEGIAVKRAGMLTRLILGRWLDDLLLVDEAGIEAAIALLVGIEKTVVEGAGAAGLAAILAHRERFAGRRVATILSGGNIDLAVIASVAMRELVRSGRLVRIEVSVIDRPGILAALAAAIAQAGGNIRDIGHERLSLALDAKRVTVDCLVEVEDRAHGERLLAALEAEGYRAVARDPA